MSQIFVFTSSNPEAEKHLNDTIKSSISPDLLKEFLSDYEMSKLSEKKSYFAWGAVNGPNNYKNWTLMKEGDSVINYSHRHYRHYARVTMKVHNPALAEKLWGLDANGNTWEFMYFLEQPTEITPPILSENLRDLLPASYQGFTKIKSEKSQIIFSKYGSVENLFNSLIEPVESSRIFPNKFEEILRKHLATDKTIAEIQKANQFWFQLGRNKLNDLDAFQADADLIDRLQDSFKNYQGKFEDFLSSLAEGSDIRRLIQLTGELIAYCDLSAAGKKKYNQYIDRRVLAKSGIRQPVWVEQLLNYKRAGNDLNAIRVLPIHNAIWYLKYPQTGITMLSEGHRQLVATHLLNKPYNRERFVEELKEFFEPYGIKVANSDNLTVIIAQLLYRHKAVKRIWKKLLEGLVVSDSSSWPEQVRSMLQTGKKVVLWRDQLPSGGDETIQLLKRQLREEGFFYIYVVVEQQAIYRARIIEFARKSEYAGNDWSRKYDILNYETDFEDYMEVRDNRQSGIAQASIVFLADEMIRLLHPVPMSDFEFYKDFQPPTQRNVQPYVELKTENEPEADPTPPAPYHEFMQEETPMTEELLHLNEQLAFDDRLRQLLMACRTKPFVLLAGISGTGKSRLVRELAYKTCALKSLQHTRAPGNFVLIPVRPNWHDSTPLLGYPSRISGKEYVVTDFLHFLGKAWKEQRIPFFVCLDEMNLAPVEHYFAEFLSLIETRDFRDGKVMADPFLTTKKLKEHPDILQKLEIYPGTELYNQFMEHGLGFPPNLVVIGTVNMDETTHSFSRKVLDRAMTIELNQVDLKEGLAENSSAWTYPAEYLSPQLVLGEFTSGRQVYGLFKDNADILLERLQQVNDLLEGTPFKIAYRVRDELLIYCYCNSRLNPENTEWLVTCFDEFVNMKILSRIEGDERKAGKVLTELGRLLGGLGLPVSVSLLKINEMQNRLQSGYTSYWA